MYDIDMKILLAKEEKLGKSKLSFFKSQFKFLDYLVEIN